MGINLAGERRFALIDSLLAKDHFEGPAIWCGKLPPKCTVSDETVTDFLYNNCFCDERSRQVHTRLALEGGLADRSTTRDLREPGSRYRQLGATADLEEILCFAFIRRFYASYCCGEIIELPVKIQYSAVFGHLHGKSLSCAVIGEREGELKLVSGDFVDFILIFSEK